MQTFPGASYCARHETLLIEAASDRRAAEVQRSPVQNRAWPRWTFATSLLRSIASHWMRRVLPVFRWSQVEGDPR
jgi:hypothetical protein